MRHRARLAAICGGLILAVAGCGSTVAGSDEDAPFASWGGFDPDRPFMQAALAGVVKLDEGCIRVAGTVLALPVETTWNPDTEELSHDGFTIKVGEEVSLTGGYRSLEFADHIPDSCNRANTGPDGVFVTTTYSSTTDNT